MKTTDKSEFSGTYSNLYVSELENLAKTVIASQEMDKDDPRQKYIRNKQGRILATIYRLNRDFSPDRMDCGDSSCLYALKKFGMRTNGGCRCFGR